MDDLNKIPLLEVSDFLAITNQTLEYSFPLVQIEGEVSSFKINQGKFVFFDLKDESASVSCFMMLFNLRHQIEDGMKVIVVAKPQVTNKGKFSLTIQSIRPNGEGNIKKAKDLLDKKLAQEGLFDESRKKPVPYLPHHIGVISSRSAAGFIDFMRILNDRWAGVEVDLIHTQVQGEIAADQIIAAIEKFNLLANPPELIAIMRGGGSAEDLMAFDDEKLVRAVAMSRIPVVTGIGHEIDTSLVDKVADFRAATPSHVAQILFPDKNEFIASIRMNLSTTLRRTIESIDSSIKDINEMLEGAKINIENKISKTIDQVSRDRILLEALNPYLVLKRGYSIIRGDVQLNNLIEIETKNEIIKAEVKNVRTK